MFTPHPIGRTFGSCWKLCLHHPHSYFLHPIIVVLYLHFECFAIIITIFFYLNCTSNYIFNAHTHVDTSPFFLVEVRPLLNSWESWSQLLFHYMNVCSSWSCVKLKPGPGVQSGCSLWVARTWETESSAAASHRAHVQEASLEAEPDHTGDLGVGCEHPKHRLCYFNK